MANLTPDVEKHFKELAANDFHKFLQVLNVDSTDLIICFEREKGSSWGQIALKVGLPKGTVRDRFCRKCAEK